MSWKPGPANEVDPYPNDGVPLRQATSPLNLILAYFPALLGLVVQAALLGLVVKQWAILNDIQRDWKDEKVLGRAAEKIEDACKELDGLKKSIDGEDKKLAEVRNDSLNEMRSIRQKLDDAKAQLDWAAWEVRQARWLVPRSHWFADIPSVQVTPPNPGQATETPKTDPHRTDTVPKPSDHREVPQKKEARPLRNQDE